MTTPDECGTYAAYQRHRRRRERACDACREASRVYHSNRRRDPKVRAAENRDTNARSRALWRLADEHRARFRELFAEELQKPEAS